MLIDVTFSVFHHDPSGTPRVPGSYTIFEKNLIRQMSNSRSNFTWQYILALIKLLIRHEPKKRNKFILFTRLPPPDDFYPEPEYILYEFSKLLGDNNSYIKCLSESIRI